MYCYVIPGGAVAGPRDRRRHGRSGLAVAQRAARGAPWQRFKCAGCAEAAPVGAHRQSASRSVSGTQTLTQDMPRTCSQPCYYVYFGAGADLCASLRLNQLTYRQAHWKLQLGLMSTVCSCCSHCTTVVRRTGLDPPAEDLARRRRRRMVRRCRRHRTSAAARGCRAPCPQKATRGCALDNSQLNHRQNPVCVVRISEVVMVRRRG